MHSASTSHDSRPFRLIQPTGGRSSSAASRVSLPILLVLSISFLLAIEVAPTGQRQAGSLEIEVIVAVVGSDLQVRPVPKRRFHILMADPEGTLKTVREIITGFDGTVKVRLREGRYRIMSSEPLDWEGATYSWDVPFDVSETSSSRIELSSDNATRTVPEKEPRKSRVFGVFEAARSAAFLIESETSKGAGFLVDEAGLILTNHHLVHGTRYLAARITVLDKFPAQLLVSDDRHDVAVVRVHPDTVSSIKPLALAFAEEGAAPAFVGETILAIGNPLNQESTLTTGIVSKLDEDSIISDVNINPGNSGGPVLNLDGAVVGISSYLIQGRVGPGLSGIVPIHRAAPLLDEARSEHIARKEPPSPTRLPVAPEAKYPVDPLREVIFDPIDVREYEAEAGDFILRFYTPPLKASVASERERKIAEKEQKRRKKRGSLPKDPSEDAFEWRRYAGPYDAVVTVRIMPKMRFSKFKADFRAMRLLRKGKVIDAIYPARSCDAKVLDAYGQVVDTACYGLYDYRIEAFEPGAPVEIRVINEAKPGVARVIDVPPKLLQRIWADFRPYLDSVETSK